MSEAVQPKQAPKKTRQNEGEDGETLPRLLGHYALLRLLMRGGMGEVYLATTIGIEGAERPCVVKRIRRDYRADPSFHARFLDEARVQAQLDDPGVARIMEASVDESGDPYVVVEYVEGKSLADVRQRLSRGGKPLAWADAVAVTLEVALALAHVHERTGADGAPLGIVHRDLSPQNVMVGFGGDVKLIDFGTARGDNRRCHTVSGVVLAKPGYVAPEVARGDAATPRADIYALGVMLWEMVSGRRFLDSTMEPSDHVAAVTSGKLRPGKLAHDPSLTLQDGPVPEELDRIVAWLTEPVASARCGRAREASQALAGLLATAPRRPVEERGVRARVKAMLARLYPTEPAASRVEFARLVARARRTLSNELSELSPPPSTKRQTLPVTPSDSLTQVPNALPGTRYRLIRRIGEGAMGVVYEAEHVDLGRRVAVKVLQAKHSTSPEFVARFRREARAIASLSHPNLVHVYDFGQTRTEVHAGESDEWANRLFFVMERLEGETLDEYLEREQGMDWRDACELAIKTCRALEAAHAAGLVHRDLKPANLFLTYGGRRPPSVSEIGLKLLDFGVAKLPGWTAEADARENEGRDDDGNLSKAGAIFGTPETMAPEQISGGDVDARADLYALGCVLYQLVTGKVVFDAPSPILTMSCHMRTAPVPPITAAPERGIPEDIERVILRALEKDPTKRFTDATEMREALEEACYGGFFREEQAQPTQQPSAEPSYDQMFDDPAAIEIMVERIESSENGGFECTIDEVSADADARRRAEMTQRIPRNKKKRSFAPLVSAAIGAAGLIAVALSNGPPANTAKTTAAKQTETVAPPVAPIDTVNHKSLPPASMATEAHALPTAGTPSLANAAVAMDTPAPDFDKPYVPKHVTPHWKDLLKGDKGSKKGAEGKVAPFRPEPPPGKSWASVPNASPPASPPSMDAAAAPTAADVDAKLAEGDTDGALALARLAKKDGSAASLRAWARAAYSASRSVEAHDACVAWLAKAESLEARLLDARALRAAGRNEEARERLEETVAKYPSSGEAKSMLKDLDAMSTKVGQAPKGKAASQKLLGLR